MVRFRVYLYPVMVVCVPDVEAADPRQAIAQANAWAQANLLSTAGEHVETPVFAEEFCRYVVDPFVDDKPAGEQSETYLDAAHQWADEHDRAHGFPLYERPQPQEFT